MELALAWGRPLHELENLPTKTIAEFKALNAISPFTHEAQSWREGLMCTIMYNQGATKKSQTKSVGELFPYLKTGLPDWIEDEVVLHAKRLVQSIASQSLSPRTMEANLEFIRCKIREQIDSEMKEPVVDNYRIRKLTELLGDSDG